MGNNHGKTEKMLHPFLVRAPQLCRAECGEYGVGVYCGDDVSEL
jgi:hypothetical protein